MSFSPEQLVVWAEIPATDLDRAIAFYNTVLNTELKKDETGPNPTAMFSTTPEGGVAGNLYPGKPAADGAGPTIHLACPDDLEETLWRVKEAGGKVLSDVITIPPGRFAYCLDTEGNSIGIFSHTPAP